MRAESPTELEVPKTLDRDLEVPAVKCSADEDEHGTSSMLPAIYRHVAVFFGFLVLVVLLQVSSGAYQSEFSVYPDEPSHYVTSLMLRDYITHFHFQSPLRFAEDYYNHYPKVAFGHWPPFFYIVQALWMLLFSASRASVRLELAFTTAILAYAVFREARRWFGWNLGLAAGFLLSCLPLVQTYSDEEMAESLLTLMCFWCTVFFARYVDSERWRDSLAFGIFFSLAVLTKGSGWLLAIIPPVTLLLSRRWNLVRRLSFWAPLALILVLCVPWQILTLPLADRGWDGGSKPSVGYTLAALVEFLKLFPQILGPVLLALMMVGIVVCTVLPAWRKSSSAKASAMFALLLGVWIFHSLVPAGVEDRKLVIAVPAMILFAAGGAVFLAKLVSPDTFLFRWRWAVIGGVTVISYLFGTFQIPQVHHYGYSEAAQFLATQPSLQSAKILISSEAGGEGLLVSEVAMRKPHPTNVVIRGTKSLAKMEWNADNYKSFYSSPAEIIKYLKDEKIELLVMDSFPPQVRFPHNELLKKTIEQEHCFRLLATFPDQRAHPSGEVSIYKIKL